MELDFSAIWKHGRELLLLGLRNDRSSINRLFSTVASAAISGVHHSRGIHGVVSCLLYSSAVWSIDVSLSVVFYGFQCNNMFVGLVSTTVIQSSARLGTYFFPIANLYNVVVHVCCM